MKKKHWNGAGQVWVLIISRTEGITAILQLAAPSPVVVCLGMLMCGKGRASCSWFHSCSWKTSKVTIFSWSHSHLKPLSMFLMRIIVSLGGESFSLSSKYTVWVAVLKHNTPQCCGVSKWSGDNMCFALFTRQWPKNGLTIWLRYLSPYIAHAWLNDERKTISTGLLSSRNLIHIAAIAKPLTYGSHAIVLKSVASTIQVPCLITSSLSLELRYPPRQISMSPEEILFCSLVGL